MPPLPAPAASSTDQAGAKARRFGGAVFGEMAEGQRQQGVARQDRRRVVIGLVHRRPAAAEIVIVHRRQIVVDQRIAVDQLDGGRRYEAQFARQPEHPGRLAQQERPQPLAAVERAMAHGGEQPLRRLARAGQRFRLQQRVQCALDLGGVLCEFVVKAGHGRAFSQKRPAVNH